jgi:chaperonin GroES
VARKFEPLGDRVVVKPTEREETTKSGLVLPDTARERPQEGAVVAIGPGDFLEDGRRKPMDVQVGDMVVYSKFAGTEMKEDEDDLLILRQSDILAKVSG